MTHEQTAFLCGHFTTSRPADAQWLKSHGWQPEAVSEKERENAKRLFYPEFVDFCFATGSEAGCRCWKKPVGKQLTLKFKGQHYDYQLDELALYLMPMQMALCSIKLRQQATDLNDLTAVMFSLRTIDLYTTDIHQQFIDEAITPLMQALQMLTGRQQEHPSALVENGNKLRIYQIVNTKGAGAVPTDDERDLTLYELATASHVTRPGETGEYSVAPQYLAKTMEENRVSVFRNWNALALMDTFTIHAYDAADNLVGNWQNAYFRMIYLHALFQKSYLFNLNIRFRKLMVPVRSVFKSAIQALGISRTSVNELVEESQSFEQHFCFYKISYNFLPLEISKAMDRGLEIREEMEQLYGVLDKEKTRRDEANDKLVNTLLFCLSLLTLFSAIWDFSCLLDQIYPYSEHLGSTILGYRTVTVFFLLLILLLMLMLYRKRK